MLKHIAAQNLNSNCRLLSVTSTSSNFQLTGPTTEGSNAIIRNDGVNTVFVVAGHDAAATAVFPIVGTPQAGKPVGPGLETTYYLGPGVNYISAIAATGTNSVYISVGHGA